MLLSQTRTHFVVLPPFPLPGPTPFRNIQVDGHRYQELFEAMQRFRGEVYLNDGAIQTGDLIDGRHMLSIDEKSWHVLSLDSDGRICACLRYLEERQARGFDDLWVRHAALARSSELGAGFRRAVETEMKQARSTRISFGEVGGWAVAESHRGTMEPLRIILAMYGLMQIRGGSAGVATATFRHGSAAILRRIGLSPLWSEGEELPTYYDPHYGCQMEVLRFDSRFPNPKYLGAVAEFGRTLAAAPAFCGDTGIRTTLQNVLHGFEIPPANPALAPAA